MVTGRDGCAGSTRKPTPPRVTQVPRSSTKMTSSSGSHGSDLAMRLALSSRHGCGRSRSTWLTTCSPTCLSAPAAMGIWTGFLPAEAEKRAVSRASGLQLDETATPEALAKLLGRGVELGGTYVAAPDG